MVSFVWYGTQSCTIRAQPPQGPSCYPISSHAFSCRASQGNRNKVRALDIRVQQLAAEGVFGKDMGTGGRTTFLPPCTIVNEFAFPGNKKVGECGTCCHAPLCSEHKDALCLVLRCSRVEIMFGSTFSSLRHGERACLFQGQQLGECGLCCDASFFSDAYSGLCLQGVEMLRC